LLSEVWVSMRLLLTLLSEVWVSMRLLLTLPRLLLKLLELAATVLMIDSWGVR